LSLTVESARAFISDSVRRGKAAEEALWKAGLNWYFREARRAFVSSPPGVPSLGRADLGKTDWERRLIERLRLLHYSWRTEQTYRDWAWCFARSLRHRELSAATGEDVRAFLSKLAVQQRVSVSTQKQALNS